MLKARSSPVEIQSSNNLFLLLTLGRNHKYSKLRGTGQEEASMQEINLHWTFMKERMPTMWILPVLEYEIVLELKIPLKYEIMILQVYSSKYKGTEMQNYQGFSLGREWLYISDTLVIV